MTSSRLALLVSAIAIAVACSSGGTGGSAATASTGGGTGNSGTGAGATTASGTGGLSLTGSSSSGSASTTGSGTASGSAATGSSSAGTTGTASGGTGGVASGSAATGSSSAGTTGTASGGTGGAASGGTGGATASSSTSGGPVTFGQSCPAGTQTILSGTVLAPNQVDPIPNVRVYDAISINPYPASYCDKCAAPLDPAYVSTFSAADGTFSLDLDNVPLSATVTFTIQIGRFRKHTALPVTPCQTQAVPIAARTLPGNSAAGDIPKIAVSAGNVDHLDAVLANLGITEYDCYEGRKKAGTSTSTCALKPNTNIAAVLADQTQIDAYHMAFLSCAPGAYANYVAATSAGGGGYDQAAMTSNTATWVAGGGRIFVTDTAYDYIAQPFPTGIVWAGPSGSPQPVDGANLGCSPPNNTTGPTTSYPINIDNPTLTAWLKLVGFPASPSVSIQGFYNPWSTIASVPTTTELIADGTLPLDLTTASFKCDTGAQLTMQDVPLTAQFDVPTCGRVIFSSYHTYTGAGANGTAANEKIMEFLIFGAAVCHG